MEKDSWDARIDMRTVEAAANAAAIASAAEHAVEMPWGLKTSMDRLMASFLGPVSAREIAIETAAVTALDPRETGAAKQPDAGSLRGE
jgi:hypothetical protein